MFAESVALERGEDLLQRALPDLPDAARRQLVAAALLFDVSGLLQDLGQIAEPFERGARFAAR